MGPTFDDSSLFDHVDNISVHNSGESMGNNNSGSVRRELVKLVLNFSFISSIQCGGAFIQQQNRGVLQETSSDGQTLLLATTDLASS